MTQNLFATLTVALLLAISPYGLMPVHGGLVMMDAENITVDPSPMAAPDEDGVEWHFGIDGWMPWITGDIIAPVSIGLDDLIKNLDFYVPVEFGVRKGDWGVDANVLWMKLSGHNNELPGEMLTGARLGMKMLVAEAVVYHRVAEWDEGRSFFEVGAGARALWLDVNLGLSQDDPGIADVSERIAGNTLSVIDADIEAAIKEAEGQLEDELEGLESDIPGDGRENFSRRVLRDRAVRKSIRRVAEARSSRRHEAGAAVAAELEKDEKKAEQKLADNIDRALRKAIPDSSGGSKGWVDPIVMARLRQQLGDKMFFQLYGDIGGFGVSSELTWLLEAGFGYQITDAATAGIYFRYWNVDYESGNFIFDVDVYGPVVSVGWTF